MAVSFISSVNLSAVYRGENIRIVADKGYVAPEGCAVNGLLARKSLVDDGKLSKVEDMLGKKVKFDKTSILAYYMDRLLGSAGLIFDDIEQVDFNSLAVVLQAFKTGAVDLAIKSEPWITQNLNTGNSVLWKDMKELIPNFQFADILYDPSILEKSPAAGKRFMVAYLKAIRQPYGLVPDDTLGWGLVAAGRIEVVPVEGHHDALLWEPHVRTVATHLRRLMKVTQIAAL